MHVFWWWPSFVLPSLAIARLGDTAAAYTSIGVATSTGQASVGGAIAGRP